MIKLTDAGTRVTLGTITEAQLRQLIETLEEESQEDQDYYINQATIALLEERGADASLVDLVRRALGEREEMDILWEPV
ncbi:MAG: galactosyldiacylglycerol synthase [Armatimonadetes bacterium]|nr:galactosyldiacylglycerol synthase [Armatimonadota bacterium]